MIETPNFTFRTVLLCDDVRQEKGNKFIILGVFVNDLIVPRVPGRVPLTFYLEATPKKMGINKLALRLSGPGEGSALIRIQMDVRDLTLVAIPGPRMDIEITQEGEFRLDASEDEESWTNLTKLNVKIDPNASEQLYERSPADAAG